MKQFKRIDYIRLNENGDFVGQWLVDAWDNEAGKYQPYGVNVSAYTCRHLNYEGIKNIIINTSFKDGKGNIIITYQTFQKKFDISRARSSEEKQKVDIIDYLNSIKETKDLFTLAVYYAQLTDLPFNADVFEDFLEYVKPYMKE